MPSYCRERQIQEDAKKFCSSKSAYPGPCQHFTPTLEDLQATSFSDFVRFQVLRKAEADYDSDDDEEDPTPPSPTHYTPQPTPTYYRYGMAKVSLPAGFCQHPVEPTGRGPEWEAGRTLGDRLLPSPIQQHLRGIGGIYEFVFTDQPPIAASDFRDKADAFRKEQLGVATYSNNEDIEWLERKFWKRLTPTMSPAMYGADMEGTLFEKEDRCFGWNVSQLNSCLELLGCDQPITNKGGGIPGVTTPYLYYGMWASVFCAHTEDMELLSINYLHAGAPKIWYAVAAGEDAKRLEQLAEGHYHHAKTTCPEYLRHKRCLISPLILKKAGIQFTTTVQYPGDVMITFPGSYHFGFNTGFNVAEATNFAVPEWVPYGKRANVCLCRPDSVRIDMNRFERLLLQYEREVKQTKRFTWREWALRLRKAKHDAESSSSSRTTGDTADQGKSAQGKARKTFWVEVVLPVATKTGKAKKTPKSKKRKKKDDDEENWHLAKPGGRKSFQKDTRVLCIMPAVADGPLSVDDNDDNDDEEDEQCFAGSIVEVEEDHVRVHLDGLPKKDDVWMPIESPKLFLDGGEWGDTAGIEELPHRHYWKVVDSKRR